MSSRFTSAPAAISRRAVFGVLGVGALLGMALVAFATATWGPAVNALALHHFTAAEGLRNHTGMTLSRGEPFVMWPPLMPVMLAIAHGLGLDYPTAGLLFNLAAHTCTLFLSGLLLWRLFGSLTIAVACQVMLIVSPELMRSAGTLQTEPLFFALVLAGLYLCVRYLDHPTWPRLWAMTIVSVLACLQRYTGVALVLAVALVMLTYPGSVPRKSRILRAGIYSFVAALPLALWMVRNHFVNQTWGVIPDPANIGFLENVRATGEALARFLTINWDVEEPLTVFDVLSGLVALVLALFALVPLLSAKTESERWPWVVYLVFPPVYLGVLLFFTSIVSLDPIANRYVVPVYPFLWGTLLLGFREVATRLARAPRYVARAASTAILALFAAHAVLAADRTRMVVERAREEGFGGFTTRAWQRSPLVLWLRDNPLEGEIYSNLPEVVIFAAGRRATYVKADSLEHALEQATNGAYLVWVERMNNFHWPFPERPPSGRPLSRVVHLDTAGVYRVEP